MGLQENLSPIGVPVPTGVEQARSQQTVLNQAGETPHTCQSHEEREDRTAPPEDHSQEAGCPRGDGGLEGPQSRALWAASLGQLLETCPRQLCLNPDS